MTVALERNKLRYFLLRKNVELAEVERVEPHGLASVTPISDILQDLYTSAHQPQYVNLVQKTYLLNEPLEKW